MEWTRLDAAVAACALRALTTGDLSHVHMLARYDPMDGGEPGEIVYKVVTHRGHGPSMLSAIIQCCDCPRRQ